MAWRPPVEDECREAEVYFRNIQKARSIEIYLCPHSPRLISKRPVRLRHKLKQEVLIARKYELSDQAFPPYV